MIWSHYWSGKTSGAFVVGLLAMAAGYWLTDTYILTDHLFFQSLSARMETERIEALLEARAKWAWVGYAVLPLLLALQALLTTLCLLTGAYLLEQPMSFKALWGIAVKALAILAVLRMIPVVVLLSGEVSTLDDMLGSDWYSLLALVGPERVPLWLQAPLVGMNVFHAVFALLLAAGIAWHSHWRFGQAVRFALGSYGAGILLWWLFLVFLQLNLS